MTKVDRDGSASPQIETAFLHGRSHLAQDFDLFWFKPFKMIFHLWLQGSAGEASAHDFTCLFGNASASDQKRIWRGFRPRPRCAINHFRKAASPICLRIQVMASQEPSASKRRMINSRSASQDSFSKGVSQKKGARFFGRRAAGASSSICV